MLITLYSTQPLTQLVVIVFCSFSALRRLAERTVILLALLAWDGQRNCPSSVCVLEHHSSARTSVSRHNRQCWWSARSVLSPRFWPTFAPQPTQWLAEPRIRQRRHVRNTWATVTGRQQRQTTTWSHDGALVERSMFAMGCYMLRYVRRILSARQQRPSRFSSGKRTKSSVVSPSFRIAAIYVKPKTNFDVLMIALCFPKVGPLQSTQLRQFALSYGPFPKPRLLQNKNVATAMAAVISPIVYCASMRQNFIRQFHRHGRPWRALCR